MDLPEALEAALAEHEPADAMRTLQGWALADRQELARVFTDEPRAPKYASAMRRIQRYVTRAGQRRGRIRPPKGLGERMAAVPFRRFGMDVRLTGRIFVPSGRFGDCRTRTITVHIPRDDAREILASWIAGDVDRAADLLEAAFFHHYQLPIGEIGCPDEPEEDAVDDMTISPGGE